VDKKAERILRKYKGKRAGVFIDDANMFHSQRRVKWLVDWKKFKAFLEANFKVKFIRYYRGRYSRKERISEDVRREHNHYAQILKRVGFEVIHRDLKKIYANKSQNNFFYKCDFDAEIGFDIAANLKKIDLVILVSGDSDFVSLSRKLREQDKSFLMICFEHNAPWEVRKIHHLFLEDIKENIVLAKQKPGF